MGDLEAYGFKINAYDPFVANKMIGRKQLTVCWHVDELKISCVDAKKVKKMIQWFESEYGEMHRAHGKRHDYLGMWLDCRSFVSYETGKTVIYVRLQKSLYGFLKGALLF